MTYAIRPARTATELEKTRAVVMRTLEVDYGYGYVPEWHWDLDRMCETYVDNPRQAMFAAFDAAGEAVATAAIRVGGPNVPPHPAWLGERYADRQAVAHLLRVATLPTHRRRGLGRRLVAACQRFVREDGGYRVLYLHTNAKIGGAEAFWRSLPTVEILDARGAEADSRFETIHFELPFDAEIH